MQKKNIAIQPIKVGDIVLAVTESGTLLIGIKIKNGILLLGWMDPPTETEEAERKSEVQAHTFPQTFLTTNCQILPLNFGYRTSSEMIRKMKRSENSAVLEYVSFVRHALSNKKVKDYEAVGNIRNSFLYGMYKELLKYFPDLMEKDELGDNYPLPPISPMAA